MSTLSSAIGTPDGIANGLAHATGITPAMTQAPALAPCVGTVKWFDSKKGFGFILNADGRDVFVHFSSIEGDGFRALRDGERVEYEQLEGDKGLSAKHVRRGE